MIGDEPTNSGRGHGHRGYDVAGNSAGSGGDLGDLSGSYAGCREKTGGADAPGIGVVVMPGGIVGG